MKINDKIEKMMWSIAFPGLGQLLNGQIVKGIFFDSRTVNKSLLQFKQYHNIQFYRKYS